MIKDVYRIDIQGIYIDIYKINTEENTYYDGESWLKIDFNYVEVQPPTAKVVKWENNAWIVVEEYLTEPQMPQEPTENEVLRDYVLDLDFRLIMMELGI